MYLLMVDYMTQLPKTGLCVITTISQDGSPFKPTCNNAYEVGNGTYYIKLTAEELFADDIMLRATAIGAADNNVILMSKGVRAICDEIRKGQYEITEDFMKSLPATAKAKVVEAIMQRKIKEIGGQ